VTRLPGPTPEDTGLSHPPDITTKNPDYYPRKAAAAERRLRIACKELARLTTPNGHARKTPQYKAALKEVIMAAQSVQTVWMATPREQRKTP
jgi:hypothetical protein